MTKVKSKTESRSVKCLTLCDPVDYAVHGILQARRLEWVAFPFSRGSSQPKANCKGERSPEMLYYLEKETYR